MYTANPSKRLYALRNKEMSINMDFFQTREKYRKREMRYSVSFLFRVAVIGLAAWLGWLWGSAEQKRLQADSNLAIYESDREIQRLNSTVEKLNTELNEAKAQITATTLTDQNSGEFAKLVKTQIANGTTIEQIYNALQAIGVPTNCRVVHEQSLAVATELYGGEESKANLFDGALRLNIEGAVNANGNKTNPWFDPNQKVKVRQAYLGGQKIEEYNLPFTIILPAQEWILELGFEVSDLRGYVDLQVRNCVIG